jgi:hypothetical protein
MKVRAIAYYLPQYHPIPENDIWWGKGFTEWTNVTKAYPLFKGHYQPRFPADLGYYDLRIPEVREAQAMMAKHYSIEGFIYYHYWFGEGRKIMEKPFNEVLHSGNPDFPFCLCWANETWRGAWFGDFSEQVLIKQTYPGREDYINHFYHLLPAFKDKRYIKVDGKPVFNVYMPLDIPNLKEFVDIFQSLAIKEGLPGVFLIASRCPIDWNPLEHGFDGVIGSELATIRYRNLKKEKTQYYYTKKKMQNIVNRLLPKKLHLGNNKVTIVNYKDIIEQLITDKHFNFDYYPCVVPNWDNTARALNRGLVFHDSTPELFAKHLQKAIDKVKQLPDERRFVFIKSWNEWAEGNYLEPDKKFGYQYLQEVKNVIEKNS